MDPAMIGVISKLVGGILFIIVIAMFKSFISCGVSLAISEWFLKVADEAQIQKIVRWLGDSDIILEEVQKARKALEDK